jgi:hypothetical protein
MSVTSLGVPTPNRSGEDLDYEMFAERLSDADRKQFVSDLVALYRRKKGMTNGTTT